MLYVPSLAPEFASGEFYQKSRYHLLQEKLVNDYAPIRYERELRLFCRFCPRGDVLDVGCSTGAFLYALRANWPAEYHVCGIDVAKHSLEYASLKGIRVINSDFPNHDFGSEQFDAVTFWAVLEHLVNPREFLAKACDCLRPKGHCFLVVPNSRSLVIRMIGAHYRYIMPEHLNYFDARTLRRLAEQDPRWQIRMLKGMHFNPVVIWQDRRHSRPVPEEERASLLRRTNAWKQNRRLLAARMLYRFAEALLSRTRLSDNLVMVLQRIC